MPAGPIRASKGEKSSGRNNSKVGSRASDSRSHTENQERAYIAASRRTDRSMEARMESARRASELHQKRTGRKLRITEDIVANEEMYEEEDPKYEERARSRGLWMNMNLNSPSYPSMPRNSIDYNFPEPLQIFRFSPNNSQQPMTPLSPTDSMQSPMQSPMQYFPPNLQFPAQQNNASSGANSQGSFNPSQWQFSKDDVKSSPTDQYQYSPGTVDMSRVLAQNIFGPTPETRIPWAPTIDTTNSKRSLLDESLISPSTPNASRTMSNSGEHELSLSQLQSIDGFPLDDESLSIGATDDMGARPDLQDFMMNFTNPDWLNSSN